MAKNRSRRLCEKIHIDEPRELGFSVARRFPGDISEEQIDKTVDDLINEIIEPNRLVSDGSGCLAWEGPTCMQETGKYTEGYQAIVCKWLEEHKVEEVRTSELFDVWWDRESIQAMTNAKLPDVLRLSGLQRCMIGQAG